MPLLTPSRAVFFLVSLLLLSALWTFGLPQPYTIPSVTTSIQDGKTGSGKFGGSQANDKDKEKEKDMLPAAAPARVDPETPCKEVRGASDVMLVLRTSKAELDGQLPAHFQSLLACVSHFAIFSDHDGTLSDGTPVHNALDTIGNTTKTSHIEFEEYDKMASDAQYVAPSDASRALDKWKFLPMVYKTTQLAQLAQPSPPRFYFFLEPGTTLSWTNLLQWLARPDYRIPYYAGAPSTAPDDKPFAQQAPGFMLSQGALRQYASTYEERYATEWESHVGDASGGDVALARAMRESRVEFSSAAQLLLTSAPRDGAWKQRFWCTPLVAWAGMAAADAEAWKGKHDEFTQREGWDKPFVQRDAFERFVKPELDEVREEWDNISSDTQVKGAKKKAEKEKEKEKEVGKEKPEKPKPKAKANARKSPSPSSPSPSPAPPTSIRTRRRDAALTTSAADTHSACRALCVATKDCLQWKHSTAGAGECHLGKTLRLGAKAAPSKETSGAKWTSGWLADRIGDVTAEWGRCERAEWRFGQ